MALEDLWLRRRLYGIRSRCHNPKATGFASYGGRGIAVCPEWASGADAFIRWSLENGARPDYELDRLNGEGHYSPENCRWVPRSVNMANRLPRKSWRYSAAARLRYRSAVEADKADMADLLSEWS